MCSQIQHNEKNFNFEEITLDISKEVFAMNSYIFLLIMKENILKKVSDSKKIAEVPECSHKISLKRFY